MCTFQPRLAIIPMTLWLAAGELLQLALVLLPMAVLWAMLMSVTAGPYCADLDTFHDAFYLLMLTTVSVDFEKMFSEQVGSTLSAWRGRDALSLRICASVRLCINCGAFCMLMLGGMSTDFERRLPSSTATSVPMHIEKGPSNRHSMIEALMQFQLYFY